MLLIRCAAIEECYYSTWGGSEPYREDLFLGRQFRGEGIGRAMLSQVARIALHENSAAVRWEVAAGNENAIGLHRTSGAEFLDAWKSMVPADDPLERFAPKRLSEERRAEKEL